MTEKTAATAAAYGEALVREIRAEMGRQEILSVRALAERSGIDRGVLNDRMNIQKRTGRRVPIGAEELYLIATALGLHPAELVTRAARAIGWRPREPQASHNRRRNAD